jgi:hypothetical protein
MLKKEKRSMEGILLEIVPIGAEFSWDEEESCGRFLRVINIPKNTTHKTQFSCKTRLLIDLLYNYIYMKITLDLLP